MAKINRYNVYDNGKLILEYVTRKDILKAIADAPTKINIYADTGQLFQNRYTFELALEYTKPDEAFTNEWKAAVSLFKNVIWVKEGGRKLCVR